MSWFSLQKQFSIKSIFAAAAVLLVGTFLSYHLARLSFEETMDHTRQNVYADLETLRIEIEQNLNRTANLTQSLASHIYLDGSISKSRFDIVSKDILIRGRIIRNIAMTRGRIVQYVYPLEGNESVVGMSFDSDPVLRYQLEASLSQKQPVIAGPFLLQQGMIGIIEHTPLFINLNDGKGPQFWGLLSAVIELQTLWDHTSVEKLQGRTAIAMRTVNVSGEVGDVFLGDASLFENQRVLSTIYVAGGSWQMAGRPADGWPQFHGIFSPIGLAGLLISTMIALFLLEMLETNRRLIVLSQEQTESRLESELLKDVAVGIAASKSLYHALQYVMTQICVAHNWDYAEAWMPDRAGRYLHCHRAYYAARPEFDSFRTVTRGIRLAKGEGLPGRVWVENQMMSFRGNINELKVVRTAEFGERRLRAGLCLPVGAGDQVALVLCFFITNSSVMSERRIQTARTIISQLGLVIDRKKAEDEVRWLNRNLEQQVDQRTRDLVFANKELESFSYTVSHDLRAPLRSMSGFANLLVQRYGDQLDESARTYLNKIIGSAGKMGELVDGLIGYINISRRPLQLATVELDEIADDIVASLARIEKDRKVIVRREPLGTVWADAGFIRKALFNVIGNAFKFTRLTKDATVSITSRSSDDGIEIAITDNGVGFDMQYANKLFGMFERLHNDKEFEGVGAGLAVARRIVNRHSGKIWFESTQGVGTTFYIFLPVKKPRSSGRVMQLKSSA